MKELRLAGKVAHSFINSKLTPLFVIAAVLLGLGAVALLPREEEPQIIVPMIDVMVRMPGAGAKEVQERVTKPMEKLLWEIPGVEYIYSTSSPGGLIAIVRFYVGQNEEAAIVRLNQKMSANFDLIPPGASEPLIKPRSINDVPILALTLSGAHYDGLALRRLAARLTYPIAQVEGTSEVKLIGGRRRQATVSLDLARMAAYRVSPDRLAPLIGQANRQLQEGGFDQQNRQFLVETGGFLRDADDVANVVVGFTTGEVYLRDIAAISDGPAEPEDYVYFATGCAAEFSPSIGPAKPADTFLPAVTISVAKRKGQNAIVVADRVIEKIRGLQGSLIPSDVTVAITRNYGQTAEDKSNELLFHMFLAVLSVTVLIALTLGVRESGIVLIAIPVTLALTLVVFYLYGYTLNRITLFALIFSIAILVDDAIVVVENIVRHARLPENAGRPIVEVAAEAVDEVGNPTILATCAVIAAILPMAFVSGLMGPYMRPIPVGASAAMVFSLLVAFIVTPWAALRLLPRRRGPEAGGAHKGEEAGWTTRLYRRFMPPLIHERKWRFVFFAAILVLLLGAAAMVPLKLTLVKMLPFDNKSEFEVIINMPAGSTLEQTAAVTRRIGDYLRTVPEVANAELYIGTAAPYNFNGLVRHYFLRRGPEVAGIQVNLEPKEDRSAQSHDIAKRVRPEIDRIAAPFGAKIQVSEVPPGPPVLQTLVVEVYGPNYAEQIRLAREVRRIFSTTPGVVDVDWYMEADQEEHQFVVDHEKAALDGISAGQVAETLRIAESGEQAGLLHDPEANEDVPIVLRLRRSDRSSVEDLKSLQVEGAQGNFVPLGEIVQVQPVIADKSIYEKNLKPAVYVVGDVAGREESPVYAILKMWKRVGALKAPDGTRIEEYGAHAPFSTARYAAKWDGEWHITYVVFRDLGLAFAVVLVLIYVLVVGWFQSFTTPVIIMAVIPLSLIGILPAHWLLGAFFNATSMIGFIAGAGIVVRNSVILVDFIELRLKEGMPLAEAVVDAGAVRFRPMMLTAAAVIVGVSPILFDPVFEGLALSLMAGEVASLLLSRMAVPVLYYMAKRRETARGG